MRSNQRLKVLSALAVLGLLAASSNAQEGSAANDPRNGYWERVDQRTLESDLLDLDIQIEKKRAELRKLKGEDSGTSVPMTSATPSSTPQAQAQAEAPVVVSVERYDTKRVALLATANGVMQVMVGTRLSDGSVVKEIAESSVITVKGNVEQRLYFNPSASMTSSYGRNAASSVLAPIPLN